MELIPVRFDGQSPLPRKPRTPGSSLQTFPFPGDIVTFAGKIAPGFKLRADTPVPVVEPEVQPASADFVEAIRRIQAGISPDALKYVASGNFEIVACQWMTDALPELENQPVPGYPEGADGKSLNGRLDPDRKKMYLAERFIDPFTRQEGKTDLGNMANMFRHEMGHMVNSVALQQGDIHSGSPVFIRAYGRDLEHIQQLQLTNQEKEELAYFLPGGADDPLDETYAEVIGYLKLGLTWGNKEQFLGYFPNVFRLLEDFRFSREKGGKSRP